ncbi:MAG: type 1 glutamine amidotransferase [Candidatus Thalassarchaeaceae archaeon]|nr:type 1 glutamine amidotransferase [Candidatus Thalassarchaeaceae archaeon]
MASNMRILMFDLLVERETFGHGGNQEVVRPFITRKNVELLLLTPQMQSLESGEKTEKETQVTLNEKDVPHWDDEYEFWESNDVDFDGHLANFHRIVMPMHTNDEKMANWLNELNVDAIVCSGSRRNVSIWEEWMGPASSLLRVAALSGTPTLGICFGHQLLCHALGSEIERADAMSSGLWDLKLTEEGEMDKLLTSHTNEEDTIVGVFSHQDHVMTIPENCTLLSTASHNQVTAIRVNDKDGRKLPAWGIQFHPEAAKARIKRAYEWGHISEEEYTSLKGEHDGAEILASFADIVLQK